MDLRIAAAGDEEEQKILWKLGFGDADGYIDSHFEKRYRPEEAAVLLNGGKIAGRTELLPMSLVSPDGREFSSVYVYALVIHPGYRGRGYATALEKYATGYCSGRGIQSTVIVPANEELFGFYGGGSGYSDAFYIREAEFEGDMINKSDAGTGKLAPAKARNYNEIRGNLLSGRLHVRYDEEKISYQKQLSQESGADIYIIDVGGALGCAAVERASQESVMIKELLLPERCLHTGLALIAAALPAGRYTVRTPAFSGASLGGRCRRFGMLKWMGADAPDISPDMQGYLGLAYD